MIPGQQTIGDILSTLIAGGWSFLGGVMRGGTDWRTPAGQFSIPRFLVSVATALVLGEVANAMAHSWGWESYASGALAGGVGYLGPAATMQFFQKKFFGDANASNVSPQTKD